jgi:hypothetical protein
MARMHRDHARADIAGAGSTPPLAGVVCDRLAILQVAPNAVAQPHGVVGDGEMNR